MLQAQRYINANIIGIDLSSSSLAFAQRKINELNIKNVELIQMDILEVGLLNQKFNVIECTGVLHHMADPLQGLEVLLDMLKSDGFLRLGLYSELGRQDIIKARKYIANLNLQPTHENIREFRSKVFSDKFKQIKNLTKRGDFYTTSDCRDLCFHSKEHRFTINQLQEMFSKYKLKFLGFLLSPYVKLLYKRYYPNDKTQLNLQNWAKFEEKHPNTFSGMYQFWVCKIQN